jgi:TorA maturation chaperone TorD
VRGDEMAAAASSLACSAPPSPEAVDWDDVEFDFNRLFVGPMELEAPPYASVYLDPLPLLMGPSTMVAREAFERLGLMSPDKNSLPDDHLALELDACVVIASCLEAGPDKELEALWRSFLQGHMAHWVPQFVYRVRSAPGVHPMIASVADALQAWLEAELEALPTSSGFAENIEHGGEDEEAQ